MYPKAVKDNKNMKFVIVPRNTGAPTSSKDTAYLFVDSWNDYSYLTMFYLIVYDEDGIRHDLGNIKIGFQGQTTSESTYSKLDLEFSAIPNTFFSLGEGVDFYKNIHEKLSAHIKSELLTKLNDIVFNPSLIDCILDEDVFSTSLLRSVSLSSINGQLRRVLNGDAVLTPYNFCFIRNESQYLASLELNFEVRPNSKPYTNIHAVIGRNGVGKTTLLNGMIQSVIQQKHGHGYFCENVQFGTKQLIQPDYFSSIVSVSFSVFDPFTPPAERSDPSKGACYYYIGLKQTATASPKSLEQLYIEFYSSLRSCFINNSKKEKWLQAIKTLESDRNFADMGLNVLAEITSDEYLKRTATHFISKMSSGHAIVILTVTKLIEKIEEKTLLLIDEPESHLHPPLLSAFTRALSNLLFKSNAVAIVATHSPVVLQEVPKTNVSKIVRYGESVSISRPSIETFAENVGVLTREVFGLEVIKSGFHELLQSSVDTGDSFEKILNSYNNQLGVEGQFLLRSMISIRDSKGH